MCGILGLIGSAESGERLTVDANTLARMRDRMAHRGPDDAGIVHHRHVMFGHRRLAVIDRTGGAQPVWSPDRRFLLVYNGELYNDADVRRELQRDAGVCFRTRCDTETVLMAIATWGIGAFAKFRGMFALAIHDFELNITTLARDPLGLKPLYYGQIGPEVIFASNIPAMLAHPAAEALPNLPVLSAYLTTIRTTLDNETLFSGIFAVRPAEVVQVSWHREAEGARSRPTFRSAFHWQEPAPLSTAEIGYDEATALVREAVVDSVARHLRSDVPRCMLLSGGLDSAIIAVVCRQLGVQDVMQTWCASDPSDEGGDREHAHLMADRVGALHHEVLVDDDAFHLLWNEIIAAEGLPLSTPNETAIYALARDLKRQATVTLSGEGADEIFAGYAGPMLCGMDGFRAAADPQQWPGDPRARSRYADELCAQYGRSALGTPVEHYLRCNSWIAPALKAQILQPRIADSIEGDARLVLELERQFSLDAESVDFGNRLLNVHRRLNLTGLVQRLDSATMLAGVEGRTPFADVRIAELAMRLPIDYKLEVESAEDGGWHAAAVAVQTRQVTTKRILRAAFARDLPPVICNRPKASFPLPFQTWMARAGSSLQESALLREIIQPQVLDVVAADPTRHWQLAWPLINLAKWTRRWWC